LQIILVYFFSRKGYAAPEMNDKTTCCPPSDQSQVFVLGLLHCRWNWSCM